MCGIFAITSVEKTSIANIVREGLKKLEYRGYDSWGIALQQKSETQIYKSTGSVPDSLGFEASECHTGFGHTRWATHGGITFENAHPHKHGKITLVHNGVTENFEILQKEFSSVSRKSETDTELLALILDQAFTETQDPLESLIILEKKIGGRFGVVVSFEGFPGFYALRRGSPLIVGVDKNQSFLASDIPAFLQYTNIVNYLDDREIVHLNGRERHFFDLKKKSIEKRDIKVDWQEEMAEKGDYPHFTIKEIFEQKQTIFNAIDVNVEDIKKFADLLNDSNGIFMIGCGTSHKAVMAAEYFFAKNSNKKVNVVSGGEMEFFSSFIKKNTVIIAVSQSGETADVLGICEKARKENAKIISITNVESSNLARISDLSLHIKAGPEKGVASTKATTSQIALLFLLSFTLKKDENINRVINIAREILTQTASAINDMLNPRYEERIRAIATSIINEKKIFIIGRGSLYPMALEASIKIQELSYLPALGFACSELKHGPLALVEKKVPCFVLGDDQETVSSAIELKSRGATIIGIAPRNRDVFDQWIRVPDAGEIQAIPSIIPIQILAYHLAVMKGYDPDKPRNLAKSVTVK